MRGHCMEEEKKEDDDVGSNNVSTDMRLLDLEYKALEEYPPIPTESMMQQLSNQGLPLTAKLMK
eukprot:4753666-Ditylum_brightwellii.AAC.1